MQSQVQSISAATCARMSVDTLALGMFVSELDCPWADTPFLLHGLLLETEAELEVICRLCKEVTVDFSRSAGDFSRSVEAEDAAPAKGVAGSSADRSVEVANVAPARVTAGSSADRWQTTSARVEAAPEPGLWASIGRIFSELLSRQRIDPAEAALATGGPAEVPLAGAPPGDDLTARERDEAALDVERFEAELPRAALMLRQSAPVLDAVYDSAENDLPLEVETLEPVVTEIVDGVLRNQDAMLWLTRLQSHDQTAHARGLQSAVYMAHFGFQLGLPRADLECLALGGVLLDIGKTQVPKEIL